MNLFAKLNQKGFAKQAKPVEAKTRIQKSVDLSTSQSTFILEPLITPSGLVDGIDHAPQFVEHLTVQDHSLPNVDLSHPAHPTDLTHPDPSLPHADTLDPSSVAGNHLEVLPFITDPLLEGGVGNVDATYTAGVFTVGATGEVGIDYLFDGGAYQGELAIFSLDGMEQFAPGSHEFIQEAAHRALSHSDLGHVVISDATEGARFTSNLPGDTNWNTGDYHGVETFSMRPGDRFGMMLVPNGTVHQVFEHPDAEGSLRPLFSLSTANPNETFHTGQIADVTGDGNTFVFEDLRTDGHSDRDYNDVIFQVRGAIGSAIHLDQVIDPNHDWRQTDIGHTLLSYAKSYVEPISGEITPLPISLNHEPLIGIIDTGFSGHNPDIDYSRIMLGHDYVDGDSNPLLDPGQENEHGTHVLGIISAQSHNDIGIDGINDHAPVWVSRAVGSGQWADSLVEFVDTAKTSGHPNSVVNLSFDLTQINPDSTISTRYELTPQEWAALEYAHQNHVVVVVAAGNDGSVMSALGQASQIFDNVITVGAAHEIDASAPPATGFARANYSNSGYGLDLMANGGTTANPLLSTVGDGTGTMAGTSVATAQVTGALSQVWAANPELSYRQVIDILKATATDLNTPGWDTETGAGLLNMVAAVSLARSTQPQAYETSLVDIPPTWSGEGVVIPLERAALTLEEQKIVGALRSAIIGQESGYDYKAVNQDSGALGFAQVMPANVGPWSKEAIGREITPQEFLDNPNLQFQIIDYKLSQYWNAAIAASGGNQDIAVRRVASAWYSGDPNLYTLTNPQYYNNVKYPSIAEYTLSVLEKFNQAIGAGTPQPVTSISGRVYTIQPGDTLWGIAQRYLGNGNRWREITKVNGGSFTEAEARRLQVGWKVILPVKNQVGTGNPTVGTPIARPTPISLQIGRGSRSPQLFQQAFVRINGNGRGLKPTGNAYRWGNGWTQEFRDAKGDRFLIMLEDGASKAFFMQYANLAEYEFMGGPVGRTLDGREVILGYPRSDEIPIQRADKKWAVWQAFASGNGTARIHYLDVAGVGSVATWGTIGLLYTNLGGAGHWLGMPTRREYIDGDTIFSDFQGGRIAYNRTTGKTEELRPGQEPSWRQTVQTGKVVRLGGGRLNFRSEPHLGAAVFSQLTENTTLKVFRQVTQDTYPVPGGGSYNTWYEVEVNGKRGYVASYYVDIVDSNSGGGGNSEPPLHANPTPSNPLKGFSDPLNGQGTLSQGPNGFSHNGRAQYAIDFGTPIGTPVYAMRSGKVVGLRDIYPDTGGGQAQMNQFNYVLIEHEGGYRSAYLHLQNGFINKTGIKVGDFVTAGQLIGYSGNSGWSTGAHLHVEVHKPTSGGYFGQTYAFEINGRFTF